MPLLLLAALIAASVVYDRPGPRADLVALNSADIKTLDPHRASWMQDLRTLRLLYEGLVRHDVFSWDYAVRPAAAERWDVSDDGRTYVFHLRPDARWTNGDAVTSEDFVAAWRRAMLPETGCDFAGLFRLIRGVDAFLAWREAELGTHRPGDRRSAEQLWARTLARFDEMVGISAPDPRTLVVELERPTPYFLSACTMAAFYPLHRRSLEAWTTLDERTGRIRVESGWTKPGEGVTNGPFVLIDWRFQRSLRFERNPDYWNAREVHLDSIEMPSIADPNAGVLAFETGAVDWSSDVLTAYRAEMIEAKRRFYGKHRAEYERLVAEGWDQIEIDRRLPADPRKHIHVIPTFGTYFYDFNCRPRLADGRPNPFADARVRRAFTMAIDKEEICNRIRRSGEPPARVLIPPGSIPGYRSPAGLGFDPEGARGELSAAGYPGGRGFITVELLFNKDAGHDLVAQALARGWERHLGVSVRLVQKELKVYAEDLKAGRFMIARHGWYGDFGDPVTFLDLSRSGDGNNDRGYSNAAYDALMDRAAAEADAGARLRILEEAERMLMDEEVPMAPIFHYCQFFLFDPARVTGISPHPLQEQQLHLVDILGDGKGAERPIHMPARPATTAGGARDDAGPFGDATPERAAKPESGPDREAAR